jgi:predicted regulator of Ras-like GTPase activity (Roadblock/LC7/MglB family)
MDEGMVSDALASFREIPGVQGAFVVDAFGRVIAHSASALFPDYALQGAAQKIALLSDSVYENFDASEEILLAFEGYSVNLRRGVFGTLVVLAERSANSEGLRMGTSVVARRLVMLHAQPPPVAMTPQPASVARTMREAGAPSGDMSRRTGAHGKVPTGGQPKPGTQRNPMPSNVNTSTGRQAPPSSAFGKKPESRPGQGPAAAPAKKKKSDIWG